MGDLSLPKAGANPTPDESTAAEDQPSNATPNSAAEVYVIPAVQNYQLGRFAFEDSMLILHTQEDIDEFEGLLALQRGLGGYATRIRKLNPQTEDLKVMREKLIASAVQGVEDSEARSRQLDPTKS